MDSVPMSDPASSSLPAEAPRALVRRSSTTLKLIVIAGLILVLHVPVLFVWNTLGERRGLRDAAAAEIGSDEGVRLCTLHSWFRVCVLR